MKSEADLPIITKVYDLILWSAHHVAQFPRSHRYTLGERLMQRLQGILESLIAAKYRKAERPVRLQAANLELEQLRFQYRLAKDLKCLGLKSYGYAARVVNEVGQMLGGWLKQSQAAGHETA
jgi:hypothetical protein